MHNNLPKPRCSLHLGTSAGERFLLADGVTSAGTLAQAGRSELSAVQWSVQTRPVDSSAAIELATQQEEVLIVRRRPVLLLAGTRTMEARLFILWKTGRNTKKTNPTDRAE